LLLHALQARKVSGAAYWYLDNSDTPVDMKLPEIEASRQRVLEIAKKVKTGPRERRICLPRGPQGCFACQPYEKILRGEGEFLGIGGYNQELYLA